MFLSLTKCYLGFALKSRAIFLKFLSVCLFQRQGPRENIANFKTLKFILGYSRNRVVLFEILSDMLLVGYTVRLTVWYIFNS